MLSLAGRGQLEPPDPILKTEEFVGSKRCLECHRDIACVQLSSDHAETLEGYLDFVDHWIRKVEIKWDPIEAERRPQLEEISSLLARNRRGHRSPREGGPQE